MLVACEVRGDELQPTRLLHRPRSLLLRHAAPLIQILGYTGANPTMSTRSGLQSRSGFWMDELYLRNVLLFSGSIWMLHDFIYI